MAKQCVATCLSAPTRSAFSSIVNCSNGSSCRARRVEIGEWRVESGEWRAQANQLAAEAEQRGFVNGIPNDRDNDDDDVVGR